jgi:hypothetical protein
VFEDGFLDAEYEHGWVFDLVGVDVLHHYFLGGLVRFGWALIKVRYRRSAVPVSSTVPSAVATASFWLCSYCLPSDE